MSIKLKKLNEQVVVITGASSGIGLATAEMAAKRGAKVVLAARSAQALEEIESRIVAAGGEALAVTCDVADESQVKRVAEEAIRRFGRIDTWVNNAGIGIWGRLDETPEADGRRLFDINFWGVVHGSMAALPHLKVHGGALINVGSEVSEASSPLLGIYTASKHAVKGYTDTLRIELERVDRAPVSITLIQPTAVDTPFAEHGGNVTDKAAKLPDPKIRPEEVAEAILKAAVKPTRDKKVGAMALMNTTVSKLMPGMGDRLSAKRIADLQGNGPPRDPQGALYQSSELATELAGGTRGPNSAKDE